MLQVTELDRVDVIFIFLELKIMEIFKALLIVRSFCLPVLLAAKHRAALRAKILPHAKNRLLGHDSPKPQTLPFDKSVLDGKNSGAFCYVSVLSSNVLSARHITLNI